MSVRRLKRRLVEDIGEINEKGDVNNALDCLKEVAKTANENSNAMCFFATHDKHQNVFLSGFSFGSGFAKRALSQTIKQRIDEEMKELNEESERKDD